MALTTKPVPIVTGQVPPLRLAVYGDGGVGKTSLALTFPKPLFIDTDGGLEGDAVASDDIIGEEWAPSSWTDLNELYKFVKAKTEKEQYGTIVVDSIDTLCRFILHEAEDMPTTGRTAKASETQLITAEQRDYGKVATAMDIFLSKLKALSRARGVHIVLTSAVRLPDPDKGRTKRTFNVQPAVEDNICYWANVYGELVVVETTNKQTNDKEEHRILWTRVSDRERKNKTRFGALRPGVTDPTFAKFVDLIKKGVK
jgi:GTPase SAR1 family protein